MLDAVLTILEFLRTVWGFLQTLYWWIHTGIEFIARMVAACFSFVASLFVSDLLFLVPLALVSLVVGFGLVLLGRR